MSTSNPLERQAGRDARGRLNAKHTFEDNAVVDTHDLKRWAGAIWATYGALHIVPDEGTGFSGSLTRRDFDRLKAVELVGSPQTFHRTAPMVNSHPAEDLIVSMIVEGEGLIVQDGRSCALGPGEFALLESTRPYTMVIQQPARLIDFAWPRDAIGLSEGESSELTARAFRSDSPMGRWLSPMMLDLYEMKSGLSESGAIRVANSLADLLVTAALELSRPDQADARSRQQYDDMVRFVERNLDNPDLSAESVADEFFVSTRTVHRLFARFGITVAAVIRDLRLEACRQMMLSPSHRSQSISYISSQFGFSSLQVFSRAFTAKYGGSPKQYRSARG
jgi:AraC-like DNA-binding protein